MTERFQVLVRGTGRPFPCAAGQTVLDAMQAAGTVFLRYRCREGGCGTCRVRVVEGRYFTGHMSAAQIGTAERARDVVLACQLYPQSDLVVTDDPRELGVC